MNKSVTQVNLNLIVKRHNVHRENGCSRKHVYLVNNCSKKNNYSVKEIRNIFENLLGPNNNIT